MNYTSSLLPLDEVVKPPPKPDTPEKEPATTKEHEEELAEDQTVVDAPDETLVTIDNVPHVEPTGKFVDPKAPIETFSCDGGNGDNNSEVLAGKNYPPPPSLS